MERPILPFYRTQTLQAERAYNYLLRRDVLASDPYEIDAKTLGLGPEYLGDFEGAIIKTVENEVEYSQDIIVNKGGTIVTEPLLVGERDAGADRNGYNNTARQCGLKPKALISFHTHRIPGGSNFFQSDHDIYIAISNFNIAFMHMVGSRLGLTALLQTHRAHPSQRRLLKNRYVKNQIDLLRMQQESKGRSLDYFYEDSQRVWSHLLASYGFALYAWFSPKGTVEKGDFQNGIELLRVK